MSLISQLVFYPPVTTDMVATAAISALNYTLLDMIGRGILEYCTFIAGTVHWFGILSESEKLTFTLFTATLAIITIAVIICSTIEVVALWAGGYETVEDFQVCSFAFLRMQFVETLDPFPLSPIVSGHFVQSEKFKNAPSNSPCWCSCLSHPCLNRRQMCRHGP